MEKIELPKVGQVWQRGKLQREVVEIKVRSLDYVNGNDIDILWRRPNTEKVQRIWLPYWKQWRNHAHLVF